jgi:hypothetical protein
VVYATSDCSAEKLANYIAALVNLYQQHGGLVEDLKAFIAWVLEDGKLTFSSEQEAERLLERLAFAA